MLVLEIVVAWLFADFITGLFHWFEDRYMGEEQTLEFASSLAADNQLHHNKPTAMLLHTPWDNMKSAAYVAWPVAMILAILGAPLWLWLGVAFTSLGNWVHRWAHTPSRQLPRWIRGLQEFGVFISPAHHNTHHRKDGDLVTKEEAEVAYCPMTDWVNPLLDYIDFWSRMERSLRLIGISTVDLRAKGS